MRPASTLTLAPKTLLVSLTAAASLPFLAEFFSVLVSLSIFAAGWHTFDQSLDRHALFICVCFLAVGLDLEKLAAYFRERQIPEGLMSVDSAPGSGACFTVRLPFEREWADV